MKIEIKADKRSINMIVRRLGSLPKELETDNTLGEQIASTARGRTDKYVPFDTGQLAGTVEVLPWKLIYTRDGVWINYEGIAKSGKPINYTREHHPLATHHWEQAMITHEGKEFTDDVSKLIIERIKRLNKNG